MTTTGDAPGATDSAPVLVFVHSPDHDWIAVYRDDAMVYEGHGLTGGQTLDILGIAYQTRETTEEYAEAGSWDRRYSEIPAEALKPQG